MFKWRVRSPHFIRSNSTDQQICVRSESLFLYQASLLLCQLTRSFLNLELLLKIWIPKTIDHAHPIRKNGVRMSYSSPTIILLKTWSPPAIQPATIEPIPGRNMFSMRTTIAWPLEISTTDFSCISILSWSLQSRTDTALVFEKMVLWWGSAVKICTLLNLII